MPAASSNKKNKAVEVHPRKVMSSSNKRNHVSMCNANFKHVVKDANSNPSYGIERLSHLNFTTINELAKQGLVRGLPKLKYKKDHLCSACSLGKSKKHTHKPKSEDSIQEKLYLLHMDLCGPMRIESFNGKKYILVIVDDYSRFTWVKFLRSKDEISKFVIKFLKMIQVRLNTFVRNIRTDNETEFVNQTLKSYYEDVRISHQTSVAQAVAMACYTQNRSLIRKRHNKTPYELLHDRKPNLKYLHVFGALCYPTNNNEDMGVQEQNLPSTTPYVPPTKNDWDLLFQPMFDEYFNPPPMGSDYGVCKARDLGKVQLGGVIFGTTNATINECLSKQLFGLPGPHFVYVKKIEPGLPLFLYNYSDKTLHGIFEAASLGQMNIDPYAWTLEGSQRTPYPAQVQIRVKLHCKALTENHVIWSRATLAPHSTIKPKIFLPLGKERARNINPVTVGGHLNGSKSLPSNIKDIKAYTTLAPRTTLTPHNSMKQPGFLPLEKESGCHMPPQVIGGHLNGATSFPSNTKDITTCKTFNEKELITMRVKDLAQQTRKKKVILMIAQLLEKVKDLMASKAAQSDKINHLEQKIASMEQNLAAAQAEIRNLKGMCNTINIQTCVGSQEFDDVKGKEIISDSLPDDSILLIGGYDGVSWLSSLDCYSPSQNLSKSLSPMHTERCYAAVSKLDGELFVFGGGTRGQWFDTVESYDPAKNQWTFCPPLNQKNGSLAGATVKDKIYALGGGNGVDCHSAVEMLDFDVGAWIPTRSMLQKQNKALKPFFWILPTVCSCNALLLLQPRLTGHFMLLVALMGKLLEVLHL
ncbi:development/cell death domain-containing protein [Tanacetum coccineum]